MKQTICTFIAAGILSLASTLSPAAAQTTQVPQRFADLGDFKLVNGQSIRACKLGYRTLGQLNAARSNAILFPTWFAAQSADVLGAVTGKEPLFDWSSNFIIVVDALGDGVSCSPSTSASQYDTAFPRFTIEDMVEAEHALVTRTLGLSHLHAVVGFSMGGMQAFQWAVRYPDFMDEAISIDGSPRPTSYDLLLYRTEIAAMPDMTAVHLIAAMNTFTPRYRVEHTSRSGFEKYYKEAMAAPIGYGTFDRSDWRAQLEAVLALDVGHGRPLSLAAARVRARMLIVASQQDHTVNPAPALEFARLLHAQTLVLHGDCGHVAPFCEIDEVRPVIDSFLRSGR